MTYTNNNLETILLCRFVRAIGMFAGEFTRVMVVSKRCFPWRYGSMQIT